LADFVFTARIGTGYSHTFNVVHPSGTPNCVQFGVLFDEGLGLLAELQVNFELGYRELVGMMGSALVTYNFKSDVIEPFILAGVGIGQWWYMRAYDYYTEHGEKEGKNGLLQLQVGGGVDIDITRWFTASMETRLRAGLPDNVDVLSILVLVNGKFRW